VCNALPFDLQFVIGCSLYLRAKKKDMFLIICPLCRLSCMLYRGIEDVYGHPIDNPVFASRRDFSPYFVLSHARRPLPRMYCQQKTHIISILITKHRGMRCRDVVVLPCRHLCLCVHCADLLRNQANKCPLCRASMGRLGTTALCKMNVTSGPTAYILLYSRSGCWSRWTIILQSAVC
jgi:hypothetical protein